MEQGRLDAHRPQRAQAADAEQSVLRQPDTAIADVQPVDQHPVDGVVSGNVGVEEVEGHPTDVDAPDLSLDLARAHRHRHPERALSFGDENGGEAFWIDVDPVLLLPPAGVDSLAPVSLAVEEAYSDHGRTLVGGLLEDVTRGHPETAGIQRQ